MAVAANLSLWTSSRYRLRMLTVGAIQVLILVVGLVRGKFLSVALGPAGYGVVATIDQLVLALISLGTLGLPFAALKFMAKSHSEAQESFEETYSGFLWAIVLLGFITATAGAALGLFAPEVFSGGLVQYGPLIAIAMLGIPAAMANMVLVNALAAAQKASTSAILTLAIQALLLVATIIGVYAAGTTGIYVTTVTVGALTSLIAIIALSTTLGSPHVHGFGWLKTELRRDRTVMAFSGWSWLATAVYTVSLSGVRTSVFSGLGAVEAGLLQAALGLALTVGAVINPVSNLILAPFLNRSIPQEEKIKAANDFALKVLTLMLLGALPIVLFPKLLMSLLFAREFLPAAGILFAFILWQCMAQLVNVYSQLLIGLDEVSAACMIIAGSWATVFLASPWLTRVLGLPGAAVALTGGVTLLGAANLFWLRRKFHASVRPFVLVRLLFSMGAITATALLTAKWPEFSPGGFGLRAAFGAGLVVIQWILLDSTEREWVMARLAPLRRGRNRPD